MVKLSVIVTPRSLIDFTRAIPGRGGGRSTILSRTLLGLIKTISADLDVFSFKLFSSAHSSMCLSSLHLLSIRLAATIHIVAYSVGLGLVDNLQPQRRLQPRSGYTVLMIADKVMQQ